MSRTSGTMRRIRDAATVRWGAAVLAASIAAAGVAVAAEQQKREVSRSGQASADGTVQIENIAGSLKIVGWAQERIEVSGTLGADVEDLEFDAGRNSVIKVVYPRHQKSIDEGADLVINLPAGSRVEIDGVSCPIEIADVTGKVYAASVSGDVTVQGDPSSVEAESISGGVTVKGGCRQIDAKSISGAVRVAAETAAIEASTVSGSLDLQADLFEELSVESVTGETEVAGALAERGTFRFDLHSGDLTLTIPADTSADFEVETFSGDISNDFGAQARKVSTYAPGRELSFTAGDGKAGVRINTFSGDVVIRKR